MKNLWGPSKQISLQQCIPEESRLRGVNSYLDIFMDTKTIGRFPFSAAILAGGQSRRMGRDKSMLRLDGPPIILRIAKILGKIFSEVFVVATEEKTYEQMGLRVVSDIYPGNDSLGGLHAAVAVAESSHVFVAGCDMPLLQPALISAIASAVDGWDVVVPVKNERPEPLCAFYGKRCEAPIEQSISRGDLKMTNFHSQVRVRRIEETAWRLWDPEGVSFLNANTPEEFKKINSMWVAGEME